MTTDTTIGSHCDTNDNSYNGWKNRETWALNLWFNNEEGLYLDMMNFIRESRDDKLTKDEAIFALEMYFKDYMEEQMDNIKNPVIKDMICFDVDYHAIAVANIDDNWEVE